MHITSKKPASQRGKFILNKYSSKNKPVSKCEIKAERAVSYAKLEYHNTHCCSKHRSAIITKSGSFSFVLWYLHGHSLVVIVISSCFGMKLQSKYFCLFLNCSRLSPTWKWCLFKTCHIVFIYFFFFLVFCLEFSFQCWMYFECFYLLANSLSCHFHAPTHKSTQLLSGWTARVSKKQSKKAKRHFFMFLCWYLF